MHLPSPTPSRLAVWICGLVLLASAARAADGAPTDVKILLNGEPAKVGTYAFPFPAGAAGIVLDNGLIRFAFNRDDAVGGVVTGWNGTGRQRASTSITVTSVIVNGTELAHNLNGVDPRDPDRQHSFYIDAGGGGSRLVCSQVKVLRVTPELAEVAFIDNTSSPLRYEHHLIMRKGKQGLYGYVIMTAAAATSISEVRMNTRWDRSIFDHAFNWERGGGQQPTYRYLQSLSVTGNRGDETWQVPAGNDANLPAGTIYTKYNWTLYHHENPMFGHYGHGFGAWLTPLGGVTDQTLCAFYGVGPTHQDLAIHQDALILNYFSPNHYDLPSYRLFAGYQRFCGPWFTFITAGDPTHPDEVIDQGAAVAEAEIAENRAGCAWVDDPLYAKPAQRTTVTGHIKIADGRPADGLWVLLSTQDSPEVYPIHEATYFVKTGTDGFFELPGIPPATQPGTNKPGAYSMYVFAAKGSITDMLKKTGLTFTGAAQDLGTIEWKPATATTFLWQIGKSDETGGEFALATVPADLSRPGYHPSEYNVPRSFEKPTLVPANLNYVIGKSWEPKDWYYAQTKAGTWTVTFNLDRTFAGTAYFTVASSVAQGASPVVAVNGSRDGVVGTLPGGGGSTLSRQADRSGSYQQATLTFPASKFVVGTNTITLTRQGGGNGFGYDTLVLEVDEPTAPPPAALAATLARKSATVWTVTMTNTGKGPANDARVDGFALFQGKAGSPTAPPPPAITGRDPNRFPVPLGNIPPGGSATADIELAAPPTGWNVFVPFSANGGKAHNSILSPLR